MVYKARAICPAHFLRLSCLISAASEAMLSAQLNKELGILPRGWGKHPSQTEMSDDSSEDCGHNTCTVPAVPVAQ